MCTPTVSLNVNSKFIKELIESLKKNALSFKIKAQTINEYQNRDNKSLLE